MDVDTIRKQLQEVQGELRRIDAEREVLINLVQGYEGWLRLYSKRHAVQPPLIPHPPGRKRTTKVSGKVSVRGAILRVLQDAQGEPLRSEEIWRRAENLGAVTGSSSPKDVVDLNLVSLRKHFPIERVAPRTYKWINGSREVQDVNVRR